MDSMLSPASPSSPEPMTAQQRQSVNEFVDLVLADPISTILPTTKNMSPPSRYAASPPRNKGSYVIILLLDSNPVPNVDPILSALCQTYDDIWKIAQEAFPTTNLTSLTFEDAEGEVFDLDDDVALDLFLSGPEENELTLNCVSNVLVPQLQLGTPYNPADRTQTFSELDEPVIDDSLVSSSPGHHQRGTYGYVRTARGHKKPVYDCCFAPGGRTFVTASADQTAKIWSTTSGVKRVSLKGHKGPVLSCDWCGVEDLIATSSEDGTVKIWASNTGKKIITLRGHTSKVYRAKFNGHGDYLASASCDGTMRLWNPHRAYQSTVKKVHSDFIYDLALSTGDGGKFAATVSNDGSWAWNDIRTQEVLRLTTKAHPTAIWGAGISHDNRIVATASLDSTIRLWEVASGNEVAQLSGHTQAVQRVMFVDPSGSGGSESILSCSRDRTVGLWDVGMRSMVMNLQTQHDMGVCGIAEYQGLMLTASTDKTVRVWKYSS